MGIPDKKKMAEAAERISRRSATEITEVIEKDEDKNLSLVDRFAAAAAALLVCGVSYFGIWFWLEFKVTAGTAISDAAGYLWIWTWRAPFYATAITTLAAFLKPGWAYRCFGKLTKAFEDLMNWR